MITLERLKELLEYNSETGEFVWIVNKSCAKSGSVAGYQYEVYPGKFYTRIKIDGISYNSHRLAYLYMTGELPDNEIDHIDGDGINNAWINLRLVTPSLNQRNRRLSKNNKSGFCGVIKPRNRKKWVAYIKLRGKRIELGSFENKEDAIAARLKANNENGFHPNHGLPRI